MLRLKRLAAAIACAVAPAMAFAQTSVITSTANSVFRDFVVPGNALSGVYNPPKADVRSLFSLIDSNKLTIPPNAPFVIVPQAGQNFLSMTYGSSDSPLVTDRANGYTGINLNLYATPGAFVSGTTRDPSTAGIVSNAHLSSGVQGIAVGGIFQGFNEASWSTGTSLEAGSIGVQGTANSSLGGALFGANFVVNCTGPGTLGCNMRGIEVDTLSPINQVSKYGLIFNSPNGDNGVITGTKTVFGGNSVVDGGAIQMFAFGTGTGYPYGIIAVKYDTAAQPIYSNGTFIRVGGFGLLNLIDARDLTIDPSGYILNTPNFKISGPGEVQSGTWHGSIIDLAHGGTNANLTASNGGILYSTASAGAVLGGTATAGLPLISGSNTTPAWGTVTGTGAFAKATSPTLTMPTFAIGGVIYTGSGSGTTTVQPSAAASGTLTLPAATDTLIGKATTDTLTNKTFDTAGAGNSFSINGVSVTANTGTGAVARAGSPTFTSPTLGAATATTLQLSSSFVYPTTDGTSAIKIGKADGATSIVSVDTTNKRVGINRTNPTDDLDILNAATASFRLDGTSGDFFHFAIGGVNKLQFGIDTGATYFDYFGIINFRAGVNGTTMASLSAAGAFSAVSYLAGSTAGVTCSGSPTASFASTNGIVTHC